VCAREQSTDKGHGMSKRTVQNKQPVKPGNQQTKVLNDTKEKIRVQKLALRDKDAEIREQQNSLDRALVEGNDWQAQQDARDLERLRRERISMSSQLDKLSESLHGYSDFMGEIDTQKRIQAMNEQKDRVFQESDLVGLFQSGQKSETHDIGLDELRRVTSPSEEKQTQKNQAVDSLMAEARARLQAKNNTNTTTTPVVVQPTAQPAMRRTNNNSSKYSQADDLIDFL
jgi:hypothetical protein